MLHILVKGWSLAIQMAHWPRTMIDGTKFWITCKGLKLLRKAVHLQLIQNLAPSTIVWHHCDIRMHMQRVYPSTLKWNLLQITKIVAKICACIKISNCNEFQYDVYQNSLNIWACHQILPTRECSYPQSLITESPIPFNRPKYPSRIATYTISPVSEESLKLYTL